MTHKKRIRISLGWSPQWSGSVEGWTKRHIAANRWRYDRIHEPEDILQDCYLIFLKICDKYPRVMENAHLMSLYKRAVINKMHDRALYVKRKRLVHQDTAADVSELYTGRIGELTNGGYAAALLNEAPEELKLALIFIQQHPEALRSGPARLRGSHSPAERENLNMQLRRLLGVNKSFDFSGALKALLT